MKILFYCPYFYPKTGGLENVAAYLAEGLANADVEIRLITLTQLSTDDPELNVNYTIIRSDKKTVLLQNYFWCDIFFHHNVSLKGIWPYLFWPFKRWVVLHHLTYYNHQKITPIEQLKRQLSRLAINISCSHFVNSTLPKQGKVIYNAFDENIFHDLKKQRIPNSIVFVGRLVSDKGCSLLINAFNDVCLSNSALAFTLTIIGIGPEEPKLKALVSKYNLNQKVVFKGLLKGIELNNELNRHQIMIIPSLWKEPFGIVALEGIAAGCFPIYADEGGLAEACGNIGNPFKRGVLKDLIDTIRLTIANYTIYTGLFNQHRDAHLSTYTKKVKCNEFLRLLRGVNEN